MHALNAHTTSFSTPLRKKSKVGIFSPLVLMPLGEVRGSQVMSIVYLFPLLILNWSSS